MSTSDTQWSVRISYLLVHFFFFFFLQRSWGSTSVLGSYPERLHAADTFRNSASLLGRPQVPFPCATRYVLCVASVAGAGSPLTFCENIRGPGGGGGGGLIQLAKGQTEKALTLLATPNFSSLIVWRQHERRLHSKTRTLNSKGTTKWATKFFCSSRFSATKKAFRHTPPKVFKATTVASITWKRLFHAHFKSRNQWPRKTSLASWPALQVQSSFLHENESRAWANDGTRIFEERPAFSGPFIYNLLSCRWRTIFSSACDEWLIGCKKYKRITYLGLGFIKNCTSHKTLA